MNIEHLSASIKKHGKNEYPKESCGIIVGDYRPEYIACENISPDPENNFAISQEVLQEYGNDIKAIIHSHPDTPPVPSFSDQQNQYMTGIPQGIFSVNEGIAEEIFVYPDSYVPLIGRPYVWKIFDCFTLVRDYYVQNRFQTLVDYPRKLEELRTSYKRILDLNIVGFSKCPTYQKNDLLFFRDECHLGVYLGDNQILHHPSTGEAFCPDNLSRRESLSKVTANFNREFDIWRPK